MEIKIGSQLSNASHASRRKFLHKHWFKLYKTILLWIHELKNMKLCVTQVSSRYLFIVQSITYLLHTRLDFHLPRDHPFLSSFIVGPCYWNVCELQVRFPKSKMTWSSAPTVARTWTRVWPTWPWPSSPTWRPGSPSSASPRQTHSSSTRSRSTWRIRSLMFTWSSRRMRSQVNIGTNYYYFCYTFWQNIFTLFVQIFLQIFIKYLDNLTRDFYANWLDISIQID